MSIAASNGSVWPNVEPSDAESRKAGQLSSSRKVLAFTTMCVGCFLASSDLLILVVSIQEIGGGLAASQVELSWVMTSYLTMEIAAIALAGWLARALSTGGLLAVSAAGFAITSLLCSMAWDIRSMIVFRAIEGLFGGLMIPVTQTAAVALFKGKRSAVVAVTIVAAIAGLAPTVGPLLSGWIEYNWSWRGLFFVNVVFGGALAILAPILVRIDEPDLSLLKRADYPGIVLMATTLLCLNYVLQEGYRWGWFSDPKISTCAVISAVSGITFILRTLASKHPIIDLRPFADRNFSLGCLFSFVSGAGILCMICLTVLFLGRVRGFIAWQNGQTIVWAGLFQLSTIPTYVALSRYVDLRWLLAFGLACFGVAYWLFTPVTNQWQWQEMMMPLAIRGIAVTFTLAPATTLALGAVAPDRLSSASGLFAMMRVLGGVVGITGCGILLNSRTNLHLLRIAEHLTAANTDLMNLLRGMAARYAQAWGDPLGGQAAALKNLWTMAYREAQVEAFADAYLVVAVCFAVCVVLVPLMRKAGRTQATCRAQS
jgi:MFS transporter, DHA2 family, multidrug resistance protein